MAVTMVIGNTPRIQASLLAPGYSIAAVIANEFTEATGDLYLNSLVELGLVLFAVLALLVRAGALKRPGLIIGCFAIGYSLARSLCELFREPDAQLGFLWNTVTMGTLLSVPLLVFGVIMIVIALRRPPLNAAAQ